jgi:hypothetical protein
MFDKPDWPGIIRSLNKSVEDFLGAKPTHQNLIDILSNLNNSLKDVDYTLKFFGEGVSKAWLSLTSDLLNFLSEVEQEGVKDFDYLSFMQAQLGRSWPQQYQKILDPYIKETSKASESFTWEGLKIDNTTPMNERELSVILDALKEGLEVLKRRGLQPLVTKTLKKIHLGTKADLIEEGFPSAAGLYTYKTKTIHLAVEQGLSVAGQGTLIERWFTEIFLHELGHHIHINLLTPQARDFWEDAWSPIHTLQAKLDKAKEIDAEDGLSLYSELKVKFGLNLQAMDKALQGIEKARYRIWLHRLGLSSSLRKIAPTDAAKALKGDLARLEKIALNISKYPMNLLGPELDILMKSEPSIQKDIQKYLEALNIPSKYGQTDVDEDFAETFVLYVADPSTLSPVARWRMGRTLYLSSLGGVSLIKARRKPNVDVKHL